MLKKQIFEQKSSCDTFKSMLDMNVRFFVGRKTSHGLTLKRLPDPQPLQRRKPHTFSQQLPILDFFELFLPTAWAMQEISQHMLTKFLESATHT